MLRLGTGREQAEGRRKLLQHIRGEALAALTYEIVPDFAEVISRFGGENVTRHLSRLVQRLEFRKQLGYYALTVDALALAERFQTLSDLLMNLGPTKPAAVRQIPLDGLADELARGALFFLGRRLQLDKQAGRNKGIGWGADSMCGC